MDANRRECSYGCPEDFCHAGSPTGGGPGRRRLVRAARGPRVQHALFVEPNRIDGQETTPPNLFAILLVIHHPELAIRAGHDTVMAGPKDAVAAVRDGIAGMFDERAQR